MTEATDINLLPLPDWMECLGEISAADIRAYAHANVARATALLLAEIEALRAGSDFLGSVIATHAADTREYQKRISQAEAHADNLRAEVEVLRELCGMAYQLAGVHNAPEKWLDALSNAAAGRPFSTDGLLPYCPQAASEEDAAMSIFMVIGEGPNGLEIPLVPFNSREDAEEFVKQFPTDGDGYLSNAFVDCNAPYTDEDYEHTELGARLYGALFKNGNYYSGCGGCYRLKIVEAPFGQPMVGWDLD